jgi:DtxR family transcriptional regulator, Mn-dependent transcriptional regulator
MIKSNKFFSLKSRVNLGEGLMIDLDYKVIKFLYNSKKPLKISQIAHKLNKKHTTLASCIKRLKEKGYVNYEPFHEVKLTNKGRDVALELLRHERLLELLLFNELEITAEEAHAESMKLNLLLSCDTINKICKKYGHPKKCPCGDDIIDSRSCFCERIE